MATTRIYRTAGTPTSQKKGTVSFWVKMGTITANEHIFDTYTDANNRSHIQFDDVDKIDVRFKVSGTNIGRIVCTPKFRDPTAWYHIVVTLDTTQSTASDRIKLYINGEQNTSADSGFTTETYPSQNADVNLSGTHTIGAYHDNGSPSLYFTGSLTHVHYTDGYAYPASTFGETDSTSGIWKPKTSPSVTYGTNGFFLKFENSGNLDLDSSGNNLSFTTAGTLTQGVDTPSNNFATMDPTIPITSSGTTLSNGLTTVTSSGASHKNAFSSLGVSSGKWYTEMKVTTLNTHQKVGVINEDNSEISKTSPSEFSGNANGYAYRNDGQKEGGGGSIGSYGNSFTAGDIIGIAMDLDNNKLYFSKNGTFQDSGNPASGASGTGAAFTLTADKTYFFAVNQYNSNVSNFNFGSGFFGTTAVASANADANGFGAFEYAVPSGYYALCTKNIKEFG